jgi:formamidopyrimidine-DNA glycosylase
MPELPEVETVRTALSKIISSSKVKSVEVLRKDLRWEIPEDLSEKLKDDILETPLRRGKYILIPTYKGNILLIHLGMSGQIKIQNTIPGLLKHDHVRIIIEKGNNKYYSITYNDPRRFGYIDLFKKKEINQHFLLKNLGVEPLDQFLTVEYLQQIFKNKIINIKNALLDQKIIAGIGNIYASEILYKAKIRPDKIVNKLKSKDLSLLITATKDILEKSIKKGGTTIKNHKQPNGKLGYFVQDLLVYGKKNTRCSNCNNIIEFKVMNNRSTYFCNKCQK